MMPSPFNCDPWVDDPAEGPEWCPGCDVEPTRDGRCMCDYDEDKEQEDHERHERREEKR